MRVAKGSECVADWLLIVRDLQHGGQAQGLAEWLMDGDAGLRGPEPCSCPLAAVHSRGPHQHLPTPSADSCCALVWLQGCCGWQGSVPRQTLDILVYASHAGVRWRTLSAGSSRTLRKGVKPILRM